MKNDSIGCRIDLIKLKKGCFNEKKTKILLSVILPACLVAVFLGYFFSVIQLMSWDVFISKPINEWFKQQNAIYFDADQVDELNIEAFNKVKNVLENKYYKEVDFNEAFSHAIKRPFGRFR